MKIEECKLPYYDEMKYFCLKNCFNQYMYFLDIKNSLLKLRIGMEFKIKLDKNCESFQTIKHTLLLPFFDMKQAISGKGNNFDKIFYNNLEMLPVIVLVDVFFLPYRIEYKKNHASHAIILCEYDELKNEVLIIDWYNPYFYVGKISFDVYRAARSSNNPKDHNPYSGFSIENYWYKLKEDFYIDDYINLINNIQCFLGNKKLETTNVLVGVNAVNKISNIMTSLLENSNLRYDKICSYLHDEIFVWVRASELSTLYYKQARVKFPDIVSNKLIYIMDFIKNQLSKVNYFLLRGSCLMNRNNLEKAIRNWNELCEVYVSYCEDFIQK